MLPVLAMTDTLPRPYCSNKVSPVQAGKQQGDLQTHTDGLHSRLGTTKQTADADDLFLRLGEIAYDKVAIEVSIGCFLLGALQLTGTCSSIGIQRPRKEIEQILFRSPGPPSHKSDWSC